jgi:EAL domain-containing protein (putative c-di-GMP-specific phosphodiesterase class I)/GGDEF domain-containing protein
MQNLSLQPAGEVHFQSSSMLREIIQNELLYPVFQPIVNVRHQQILGYEALIRGPDGSPYYKPIQLFSGAKAIGMDVELEVLCRKCSIREFVQLGLSGQLFLNISPGALLDPAFRKGRTLKYLQEYCVNPERVVIEITEQHETKGYQMLAAALAHYRGMGFTVALDDLGAGYSGLRLWSELLPDFIKVDKHFVRRINSDRIKASFVTNLLRMSSASNCQLIAEGVEDVEELKTLQRLGVTFVQGYYFARPERVPPASIAVEKFPIEERELLVPLASTGNTDLQRISRQVAPLSASVTVNEAVDHLQRHPELQLLAVLDGTRPVGIINRHQFFNRLMATRFGMELYGKRRISKLLGQQLILVDLNAELETVSQQLVSTQVPEQAFIIMDGERYHGVASLLDLLEIITEQKIQHARHANPLTLLPGIVPVNHAINKLLAAATPFAVSYWDIDNFKPYNDFYGYAAGDRVIQLLAELLRRIYDDDSALIGHIGGDDFIVVDFAGDYQERVDSLLAEFAAAIPSFYEAGHRGAGGMSGLDRQGVQVFFGLASVSVGIVPPAGVASCQSHIEIADLATEAKKQAKKCRGNSMFVNRRAILRV